MNGPMARAAPRRRHTTISDWKRRKPGMSNIALDRSHAGSKATRRCATGILPLVFWMGLIGPTGFAAPHFAADAAAQPSADHTRSLQSAQLRTEEGPRPSQAGESIE